MFVNHPLLSVRTLSEIPLINHDKFPFGGLKATFDLAGGKYVFALLIEEQGVRVSF